MRISTSMIYDLGVASIQQRTQEFVKIQQQVSSGQRMLSPADDPLAAASALAVKQSLALNEQFHANGDTAIIQLALEETALSDVTTLLQDVKEIAVNAGNAALTNSDRASLAIELETRYQALLGISNSVDSNGQFLFSGYKGATPPFAQAGPGVVTYAGDSGQRQAQIGAGRTIATSDSGDTVFRAIKNGNGTFATAAGAANTGSGVITPGVLTDPTLWKATANPRDFTVKFDVTGGATTYDIIDNVNNVSLLTGAAPAAGPYLRTFVSGQTIDLKTVTPPDSNPAPFDFGTTLAIDGAPASGDTFGVKASANQDMFATLQSLISTLRTGMSSSPSSAAAYQNALNATLGDVDNALDNVLEVRASVGARLKEIDAAQSTSDDLGLQYSQTLAGLQDLDFAKAISDLTLHQTLLQAAQQSFVRITSLNLFSLL